jgi:hypothetical protein
MIESVDPLFHSNHIVKRLVCLCYGERVAVTLSTGMVFCEHFCTHRDNAFQQLDWFCFVSMGRLSSTYFPCISYIPEQVI